MLKFIFYFVDNLIKHQAEVKDMILTEYDEEKTMRLFRKEFEEEAAEQVRKAKEEAEKRIAEAEERVTEAEERVTEAEEKYKRLQEEMEELKKQLEKAGIN